MDKTLQEARWVARKLLQQKGEQFSEADVRKLAAEIMKNVHRT